MTDEELIEAMNKAFGAKVQEFPNPTFSECMGRALAVATPEIEQRLIERMREWISGSEFPLDDKTVGKFLLTAFARENEID